MDNLIFLLVFAAIAGLQWLFKKMQENAQRVEHDRQASRKVVAEPQRRPVQQPAQIETEEEERMRKFLEALGLPSGSSAPSSPPPQPVFVPPPIPQSAPPLPRRAKVRHKPVPVAVEEEEGPRGGVVEAASKAFETASRIDVSADRETGTASVLIPTQPAHKAAYPLPELLTPKGLREAMVLREVLGPPLALR